MSRIPYKSLIFLSALATGHLVLSRWWRTELCGVDLCLISVGLGLAVLAYATFGIALVGGLHWPAAYALLVLPILLNRRGALQLLAVAPRLVEHLRSSRPGWATTGLLAFLVVVAAWNLVGALGPPTVPDALTYHLALPRQWIRFHSLDYIDAMHASGWPATVHMLYTLADLVGDLKTAQLINWGMGILALGALFRLGRVWLGAVPALLACATFYALSDVSFHSAQVGVELGATALLLGATVPGAVVPDQGGVVALARGGIRGTVRCHKAQSYQGPTGSDPGGAYHRPEVRGQAPNRGFRLRCRLRPGGSGGGFPVVSSLVAVNGQPRVPVLHGPLRGSRGPCVIGAGLRIGIWGSGNADHLPSGAVGLYYADLRIQRWRDRPALPRSRARGSHRAMGAGANLPAGGWTGCVRRAVHCCVELDFPPNQGAIPGAGVGVDPNGSGRSVSRSAVQRGQVRGGVDGRRVAGRCAGRQHTIPRGSRSGGAGVKVGRTSFWPSVTPDLVSPTRSIRCGRI